MKIKKYSRCVECNALLFVVNDPQIIRQEIIIEIKCKKNDCLMVNRINLQTK